MFSTSLLLLPVRPSATSECTSFCGCHSLAHLLTLSQSLPDTTSTRDLTEWHKFDMDNIRLLRHASGDWGSSLMRAKSTQSSATPCKYVYNFGLHRQTSSMTDPTPQKDQLFSSAKKFSIGVPFARSLPRLTDATCRGRRRRRRLRRLLSRPDINTMCV